ncbi:MAG: hypothetical protein QOH19_2448 [Actinomycetota bacterium]|nr:hypothetical protein [Actinomycetota bacterium]
MDCDVSMVMRCSTVAAAAAAVLSISASWLVSRRSRGRQQLFGCHHDEALEFVDGLGAADQHRLAGRRQGPDPLAQPADPRTGLVFPGHRGPGSADRVEPVVLGTAGAFEGTDFHDILTGQGQFPGQPGGEAPRSLQCPDPAARCMVPGPVEHARVSGAVGRRLEVGAQSAGGCIRHRQVDGVAVRITAMT